MEKTIKDIAIIQMGYPFRSRLEFKLDGAVSVIQMKDLGSDNIVHCESVQKVDMEIPKEHHLVQKGDLIFRSRGVTTTVAILNQKPRITIVSAPLLRIRINNNAVLPEYLCWFINQDVSQQYLKMRQEGTHGGMISRQILEGLPVNIPSLEKQRKIIEIINLQNRQVKLEKKRIDKQDQIISAMMLKLAKGE